MNKPRPTEGHMRGAESLGFVTCPSGILLVLDGGLARLWSHDRAPLLPDHPAIVGATESARDLAISGQDAFAAGQAFGKSYNPLFIYDQSAENVAVLQVAFADLVAQRGFNASLDVLAERVPHRTRIDLLLDRIGPAGIVEFHGSTTAIVSGVPRDRELPIWGERMPAGPDEGCWRRVWIDIRAGETASQRNLGEVWVDEARLMAVDVSALGHWDDRDPQDGKADVAFWGRDAALVAAEVGAPLIEKSYGADTFGWLDLPVQEALKQARRCFNSRSDERKFAVDFRPHTHQWQVMRDVRKTPTESAIIEIEGSMVAMFMTTWGDGAFPVEVDLSAQGEILRIRVELA